MKAQKSTFILIIVLSFCLFHAQAIVTPKTDLLPADSIQGVKDIPNLFQWGSFYLGGQPNLETMELMKEKGVDLIINLRSEKEMDKFKKASFNEEKVAKSLNMDYLSVHVDGYNSYTPENLKKFNEALNSPHEKVLIHCLSCGRVTQFIMAYLIQYKGYSIDDAIAIGKKLKYKSGLEMLLGKEISMSYKL